MLADYASRYVDATRALRLLRYGQYVVTYVYAVILPCCATSAPRGLSLAAMRYVAAAG